MIFRNFFGQKPQQQKPQKALQEYPPQSLQQNPQRSNAFLGPRKRSLDQKDTKVESPSKKPKKAAALSDEKVTIYDKFIQGDIVFGLAEYRDAVGAKLKAQGFTDIYANNLNCPAVERVINGGDAKDLSEPQRKHFEFLNRYQQYLRKKPGKTLPNLLEQKELGAAYRRACKLSLNKTLERGGRSHVITKGD